MKSNSIGNIAVSFTKRPRQRFNMSSDLHTTMDFGSVIPAKVQLQIPNSKLTVSSKERILCSPMLAPTMGRMSLKVYHNFVRLSDLTQNFAAMLAQESVNRGGTSFLPLNVPSIELDALSSFVLIGSFLQVYRQADSQSTDDTPDTNLAKANVYSGTSGDLVSDADLSALGLLTKVTTGGNTDLGLPATFCINPRLWLNPSSTVNYHAIPLGNPNNATFYPIDPSCDYYKDNAPFYDLSDVTPANADYVIPIKIPNGDAYYLCFRLSDYGKRLRKILIGCGYQIDFTSKTMVSVLPLLAFYKSYFDVFGLTLYQNWEQSHAYGFLYNCDLKASPLMSDYWTTGWSYSSTSLSNAFFWRFITLELGFALYTDEQDFVSAHTRSNAISPSPAAFIASIDSDVDINTGFKPNMQSTATSPSEPSGLTTPNGHAYINSVLHGQLDSELLKVLYRWTNRNTIAGRRIAELLRAQGLGSYVDECKSDFIGSFDLPIDVYDGISSADTYSPAADSGAPLGERYGNGQAASGDDRNRGSCERTFDFECNEYGYWVTLFTIVPKGGYVEALDPTVLAKTKFEFYTPDFDSKGMEFDPKSLVVGSMPFADFTAANGSLSDSFGLAPRFFRWKFGRSVVNGDFSRRSVRDSFAPYYLDKKIDVGDRFVRDESPSSSIRGYSLVKVFKPSNLPIAGNVWRYPTRYPFIGRFNRIFNRAFASMETLANYSQDREALFEFFSATDDNFIVHAIFDVQYYAPMLAVEDSFETFDDENKVNGSMGKA